MSINYSDLPRETHLTLAEIATSNARGRMRKGITTLSPQTIRRLEAKGEFPKSRSYSGAKGRYYILGEVMDWMEQQNANTT
ncbi:MAG: helix-turn-helix transcriptional regulator [Cardiobacterium sp.]|nr:MAG TPA: Tor inhibition protein helix, reverse turn, PROTEIN [Caudoviricetes sp.]